MQLKKVIKYYTYQPAHGYFCGAVKDTGICPTIDASIMFWHTLIIEKYDNEDDREQINNDRNSSNC